MAFPWALLLAFRTAFLKGHRPQADEAHHMASLRLIPPRKDHLSCPDYTGFFYLFISTYVTGHASEQGQPLSDSYFALQSN